MKRLFLSLLLVIPGCASGADYLVNRGDLADIIRVQGMVGNGAAVKLEATRVLHAGIGWYDAYGAGFAHREASWWTTRVFTWGLVFGRHNEEQVTRLPRYSGSYGWMFDQEGVPGVFDEAEPENPLDLITFRGTLFLFIGLDLEVRVGEALDFVAGIFQFDPAGDDGHYYVLRGEREDG